MYDYSIHKISFGYGCQKGGRGNGYFPVEENSPDEIGALETVGF